MPFWLLPQAQSPDAAWKRLELQTLQELAELADWAGKLRMHKQAHELYRVVLRFDPEHKRARRVLKFRKNKAGDWEQAKYYREPKEREVKARPEFDARWQKLRSRFVMQALHDRRERAWSP